MREPDLRPHVTPSVLHVITGLTTGGAETMLWKLLAGSAELRSAASVLSLMGRGTLGPRIEALGVPLACAGMRRGLPGPIAMLRARAVARRTPHQLLQGWMYHANLAALALAAGRVPVLWNIRQSFSGFAVERPLTRMVVRACARVSPRAARIVYNSRASAAQHEAIGFDAARRVIIPNGFDTGSFRPDPGAREALRRMLGLAHTALLVGLVARWHPMKNHAGFLAAGAQLAALVPSAHLVLAGQGVTAEKLGSSLQADGLPTRVHFLGEVSEPQQLMAGLDVLCSASAWGEGFPNVVGEAMASGVPCVVTDVGDSAWLVADTGFVVPPSEVDALASALIRMLGLTSDERRTLGERARSRIESAFALPAVAQRYAELYREVGAGTPWSRSESSLA